MKRDLSMKDVWHDHCQMSRGETRRQIISGINMNHFIFMKITIFQKATGLLLTLTILFSTLGFSQTAIAVKSEQSNTVKNIDPFKAYLMEVPGSYEAGNGYSREIKAVSRILTEKDAKDPVLI